jgi:ribonuclease J
LGGLGEIGKNMMVVEYADDIIVIDAGLMFPEEEMLGIDLVIPDISYLVERKDRIRGIVITHAHEDHIGALPYVLPQLGAQIYATKLAQGIMKVKSKGGRALAQAKVNTIEPGVKYNLGRFKVEPFPVCHSIPDSIGLIIHTPVGIIVHSGDFKLDYTPVDGRVCDFSRLAHIGGQGVLLLMSDSTYAETPGYTPSEKVVGETLDSIMGNAQGRVIVTTFASLVSRVQQVIDAAARHGRRVFIVGRSMAETFKVASELGYMKAHDGVVGRIDEMRGLPHNRIVLVTTGAQGEPTSALVRIANGDHRQLHIMRGDTVVISASTIPGNESLVNRTVDSLFRQGADVFYDKLSRVHVHGHGSQEELKLVLNLVQPKYFMPIHGEYRHLSLHAKLARSVGVSDENAFVLEDGDILELTPRSARQTGKVSAGHVYVDGLSVGDVGSTVLRSRKMISRDGIAVVIMAVSHQSGKLMGQPQIVSQGFVDYNEAKDMLTEACKLVAKVLGQGDKHSSDRDITSNKVREALKNFFYEKTHRRPMILPVVIKV